MKKYLLFDLDGTLTDPKVGITTCVQYALKSFGIEEPDLDKLEPFIGPPLKDSFMNFYQMSEEQAAAAVEKYRERFQDIGILENELYEGIPEMLKMLQSKGLCLAVASSKPTVYVERILEHFHIEKYFKVVVGSELDGTRAEKAEVVQEALNRLFGNNPIQKSQVYMIGDRKFDVKGAKALGVESVAVSYGYGSMEELKEAKADYIVRSVGELQKFLLRGVEEANQSQVSIGQRIWSILFPYMLFLFVRNVTLNFCDVILLNLGNNMPDTLAEFLVIKDKAGVLIGYTGNANIIILAISFLTASIFIWPTAKGQIQKTAEEIRLAHLKEEPKSNYIFLSMAVIGLVIGLNLLLELIQLKNSSQAYQTVAEKQYSANLLIGLICYGLVTPMAEEVLFRGIIYNAIRRFGKVKLAILLSSVIFALYHMNIVQGIYALLMGCLIAYSYEYFGNFFVAVLVHMACNMIAYSLSSIGSVLAGLINWPVCILFLVLGAAGVILLHRRKNIL